MHDVLRSGVPVVVQLPPRRIFGATLRWRRPRRQDVFRRPVGFVLFYAEKLDQAAHMDEEAFDACSSSGTTPLAWQTAGSFSIISATRLASIANEATGDGKPPETDGEKDAGIGPGEVVMVAIVLCRIALAGVAASFGHQVLAGEPCPKCVHEGTMMPQKHALSCVNSCAGGGIRTLTLSRAPAPKAGMSAVPSRPRAQKSYRRPCLRRPRWSLAPSRPGSTF
jgi:hypothetical protein